MASEPAISFNKFILNITIKENEKKYTETNEVSKGISCLKDNSEWEI